MNGISKVAIAVGGLLVATHAVGTYLTISAFDLQSHMMEENQATATKANSMYIERLDNPKYAEAKNDPYFSSEAFTQKVVEWNKGEDDFTAVYASTVSEMENASKAYPFSHDALNHLKDTSAKRVSIDIENVNKFNTLLKAEKSCTAPATETFSPEEKALGAKYFCS